MPDPTKPHLCFSGNTNKDLAQKRFTDKYGVSPRDTFIHYQLLWVGPIPTAAETNITPISPEPTQKAEADQLPLL